MEYIGRINFNTRVCRGLDSVQAILEGRVAKLAHCDMDNVRAVALVCFEGGLNVSLKFDTPACRRSAVDAVSLGLSVMQHILAGERLHLAGRHPAGVAWPGQHPAMFAACSRCQASYAAPDTHVLMRGICAFFHRAEAL